MNLIGSISWYTLVLGGLAAIFMIGSQRSDVQSDEQPRPQPVYGATRPTMRISEVPPPPPTPAEVATRRIPELITCFTDGDAVRRHRIYLTPCSGGPADGRVHLLPIDPTDLLAIGSLPLWVPTFGTYAPLPPPLTEEQWTEIRSTGGGSTVFVSRIPDRRRMEIDSVAIYILEETSAGPRLSFEGTVEMSHYAAFVQTEAESSPLPLTPELGSHVSVRSETSATRRFRIHPTKCIGGPGDGLTYPLLSDPRVLFNAGLDLVTLTEVSRRPPETPSVFGRNRTPPPFIGHLSLYAIERDAGGDFQLRFVSSVNAAEYLESHIADETGEEQ